ncbi:MAG: AAA family ATPase [Aliishimia sp.]
MTQEFVLITGCSGGGKSALLDELRIRGYVTIAEPGRRIVAQELAGTGRALPWVDMAAFADRAVAMARTDLLMAKGVVFFDRGLIDAAVALQFAKGTPYKKTLGAARHYSSKVFFAPPWEGIFAQDSERKHDFKSAVEEAGRLEGALTDLGYDICKLPKLPITERAEFVLNEVHQG